MSASDRSHSHATVERRRAVVVREAAAAPYCDSCGRPAGDGDHARCRARRAATDPPRWCTACGRKLVVQVLPVGWTARCVSCGPLPG